MKKWFIFHHVVSCDLIFRDSTYISKTVHTRNSFSETVFFRFLDTPKPHPMAFIPQSNFIPRTSFSSPVVHPKPNVCRRGRVFATGVKSGDAMEFFRHREGEWDSWRVTHHLAFRRSESGESRIRMHCLDKEDERVIQLCKDWEVDPSLAQGGCYVSWKATMAWDQEGENHEGSTVFALVPNSDNIREGRILRDRGYAEIVPIAGTFNLDDEDDLCLDTPYEGGAVEERFSFDGPDTVNRVSTVRRFGGFSTATFSTERRVMEKEEEEEEKYSVEDIEQLMGKMRRFDDLGTSTEGDFGAGQFGPKLGKNRFATVNSQAKPSTNSAFGSGFSSGPSEQNDNGSVEGVNDRTVEAAKKAGVDLSKIPPSMRDDFVASFQEDDSNSSEEK